MAKKKTLNPIITRGDYIQKPLCSYMPDNTQFDNNTSIIVVKEFLKLNLTKLIVVVDPDYNTELGINNFMNEIRIDDVLSHNYDFRELLNYYIATYISRILVRSNIIHEEQTIAKIRNQIVDIVQNAYRYITCTI